jgi:hypothetical protein
MNLLHMKCLSKYFFAFSIFFVCVPSRAQDTLTVKRIPAWANSVLENSSIASNYKVSDKINPFYLEADFNGDELMDIVFFIESKTDGKHGIVIINRGTNNIFVLGAGKDLGMGSDISWCNTWFVYRDKWIYNFNDKKKKFSIRYPGIEIVKSETTSAVVYWDGRRYKTYIKRI